MWSHSDRFAETLTRAHDVLSFASFLVDGEMALTTGDRSAGVRLAGGTISEADAAVRRTTALTFADVGRRLTPVIDAGFIVPGISEVRVWSGVRYWDATPAERANGDDARAAGLPFEAPDTEYVPVITGPVTGYDLTNYPTLTVNVSDRMWYLTRPFSQPYNVAAGVTLDLAILNLLQAKVPPEKLDTNIPTTGFTSSLLVLQEQSVPADTLKSLGTAAGWTVYADQMGTFVAKTEPTLDPQNVVAEHVAGPGSTLIQPRLTSDVSNIYNTWVVTGEAPNDTSLQPWAKVVDDDPASVTFVRSSYDELPRFISSPILTSDAQCLLAAQTYRARERGIADQVSAQLFPNPALAKGDVIHVAGGLVDRLLLVDALDFDLTAGGEDGQSVVGRLGITEDQVDA